MKRIAALAAWLLVAAAPRALAGPGGDGEVKAVAREHRTRLDCGVDE